MHRLMQEFDSLPRKEQESVIREFRRENMQATVRTSETRPATVSDIRKLISRYNSSR